MSDIEYYFGPHHMFVPPECCFSRILDLSHSNFLFSKFNVDGPVIYRDKNAIRLKAWALVFHDNELSKSGCLWRFSLPTHDDLYLNTKLTLQPIFTPFFYCHVCAGPITYIQPFRIILAGDLNAFQSSKVGGLTTKECCTETHEAFFRALSSSAIWI